MLSKCQSICYLLQHKNKFHGDRINDVEMHKGEIDRQIDVYVFLYLHRRDVSLNSKKEKLIL